MPLLISRHMPRVFLRGTARREPEATSSARPERPRRPSFEGFVVTVRDPSRGHYSLSGKTFYRKISRSLEAARFYVIIRLSFEIWRACPDSRVVKFQSDRSSLKLYLAASGLREIWRQDVLAHSEWRAWPQEARGSGHRRHGGDVLD